MSDVSDSRGFEFDKPSGHTPTPMLVHDNSGKLSIDEFPDDKRSINKKGTMAMLRNVKSMKLMSLQRPDYQEVRKILIIACYTYCRYSP